MRRLILLLIAISISSCANYRSQQYFERDVEAQKQNEKIANADGRATVYLFHEPLLMPALIYVPLPAIKLAIDERLTATMPVGSYTIHSLEPGNHKFSSLLVGQDLTFKPAFDREDIEVNLQANNIYYVGFVRSMFGKRMRSVKIDEGKKIISKSEQAKLIHNPVTIDTYIERVKQIDADNKSKKSSTSFSEALPSNQQVKSFLEGLATVAFIALMVVGAPPTQGATYQPTYAQQPAAYYSSNQPARKTSELQPSRITNNSASAFQQGGRDSNPQEGAPVVLNNYSTVRQSDGTLSEIIKSKDRIEVRNLSTSTRYSIEDGKISGSDGSRYRVLGPNIISDTGQTYQVIGNFLYTGDGRTCQKIGNQITCN